jgi:hypothetical protein
MPAIDTGRNGASDRSPDIAKCVPDLLKQHAAGGAEGK